MIERDIESIDDIMGALGIEPGDAVELQTPQFERTDGAQVGGCPPATVLGLLHRARPGQLMALGMRPWNDPDEPEDGDEVFDGKALWLFPHEWYEGLPAGLEIVDILGNRERFVPGETDDDKRFGMLAFGVLVREGV